MISVQYCASSKVSSEKKKQALNMTSLESNLYCNNIIPVYMSQEGSKFQEFNLQFIGDMALYSKW